MTIKIERDALLTVLSRAPTLPLHHFQSNPVDEDEWVEVSYPKDQQSSPVESYDDDCCSLASTECSSLSSDRRVSFADSLVTEIKECPRTPIEDVPFLFYSPEQLTRFRQEYRLERKLLAELDVDPSTTPVDVEELSNLFATSDQAGGRHHISRVVVLHEDKIETFGNPEEMVKITSPCSGTETNIDVFFDNDSFWSGSLTWY